MNLRIEDATTGEIYTLRREQSIEQLKLELGLHQSIPSAEQILLFGPPYKTFDILYRPDINLEGKRIFLYDRRIIADENMKPTKPKLLPNEVPKPDPLVGGIDSSELIQAGIPTEIISELVNYALFFKEELHKGRSYEKFVKEASLACRKHASRVQVQLDAISAVVGNMNDIFQANAKTFTSLHEAFTSQQQELKHLLDHFLDSLEDLKNHPLHPVLIQSYQQQQQQQQMTLIQEKNKSTTLNSQNSTFLSQSQIPQIPQNTTQIPQTLYDLIPADREKSFFTYCYETYTTTQQKLQLASQHFSSVQNRVLPLVVIGQETGDEEEGEGEGVCCSQWTKAMDQEEILQSHEMEVLRSNYQFVYEALNTLTASPSPQNLKPSGLAEEVSEKLPPGITHLHTLLQQLSERKASYTTSNPQFASLTGYHKSRLLHEQISSYAYQKSSYLYTLLRQINTINIDIQYTIKVDNNWMNKMVKQQQNNEFLNHLHSLIALPQNYNFLLYEVKRRLLVVQKLEFSLQQIDVEVTNFRENETAKREDFMKRVGWMLPPVLVMKLLPGLKEKPPMYVRYKGEGGKGSMPFILEDLTDIDLDLSLEDDDGNGAAIMNGDDGDDDGNNTATTATTATVGKGDGDPATAPPAAPTTIATVDATTTTITDKCSSSSEKDKDNQIEHLQAQLEQSQLSLALAHETISQTQLENQKLHELLSQLSQQVAVLKQQQSLPVVQQQQQPPETVSSVQQQQQQGYELMQRYLSSEETIVKLIKDDYAKNTNFLNPASALHETLPSLLLSASEVVSGGQVSEAVSVSGGGGHKEEVAVVEEVVTSVQRLCTSIAFRYKYPQISFMDFKVGDIALFMPALINNRKIWMAFNSGYPYRFLAEQSLEVFLSKSRNREQRASIIGRIILIDIDTTPTTPVEGGNAYNIPPGTEYYICHAEPLYKQSLTSASSMGKSGTVSGSGGDGSSSGKSMSMSTSMKKG